MDMHIERMLFERIAFSPDSIEHLLARKYTAGRFEELLENLEFLGSQIDRVAVDLDFMTIEVHSKIPCVILSVRLDASISASKDCAHPRNQLTNTLAAYDQVDILIVFCETVFILARNVSILHGNDRNRA